MSIVISVILGFSLADHELPCRNLKHKAPPSYKPFLQAVQFISEEAKCQFSEWHAEIMQVLKNTVEARLLYFLILNSTIDSEKNLTFDYDTMRMVFNIFSTNDKKTEFEVLGKYIKTVQNLLHLYRIGGPTMDFCFDV